MGHTARPDDRGRPGRCTLDQPLFPGRNSHGAPTPGCATAVL